MRTKGITAVSVVQWKHVLFALVVTLVAFFATTAEAMMAAPKISPPPPTGSILGRIELVPGVPMRSCNVLLAGLQLSTKCDNEGLFRFDKVPIGVGDLIVTGEWLYDNKSPKFRVGVNKDEITNMGTLIVSHYGAIHGQVINADPEHLAAMVVTIEYLGIAAKPNDKGYYVLDRLPPGDWWVILHNIWYGPSPTQEKRAIVKPRATTKKVDFVLNPPVAIQVTPKTSVPLAVGKQVTSLAKVSPIVNIAGQWKSNIGLTYSITQQQNNFQWTVMNSTEIGNGTIKGDVVTASWKGPTGIGSSQGKITVDAKGNATKIIWNNNLQFYR
jgi:hypothetical protein